MLHKSFDVDVKTADAETGTFIATVSVFGNVDSVGDRVMPGAFKKTLEKWRASGDPIPVILSHKHDDPMAHIGIADPNDVVETNLGLQVTGKLDVADNEIAKQVHRLMLRRSLKEFSFGYRIPRGGEMVAEDGANELKEISLIEVGPCLKGANPSTELHAVKSALEKADWSPAYINVLPDSAFLYIESGGTKDDEGRTTPRSLRHFPYKALGGRVDAIHLRTAAAQIPETSLSDEVKHQLVERIERLVAEGKADPPDEKSLRRATDESELNDLMAGAPDPDVLAKESVADLTGRVKSLSDELMEVRHEITSPTDGALRRRLQEARLKDADVPEGEAPDPAELLDERMGQIQGELHAIKEALERKPPEREPEPLSAAELRRRDAAQRLKDADVPEGDADPKPDAAKELAAEVERLKADLLEVKAEVKREPEEQPPAEDELRREVAEQRLKDAEVPEGDPPPDRVEELTGQMERMTAELTELKEREAARDAADAEPELPSEDELRRQNAEERLKDAGVAAAKEEARDRAQELAEALTAVKDELAELKRLEQERQAEEQKPPEPTEDELRRRVAEEQLKEAGVLTAEVTEDPVKDLTDEVASMKAGLEAVQAEMEREPEPPVPPSEDELRRQAAQKRLADAGVAKSDAPDRVKELSDAVEALEAKLAEREAEQPPEPPSDELQRRRMARERLKDAGVAEGEAPNAVDELKEQLKEQLEELRAELTEVKAEAARVPEPVQTPPSEDELRRRIARERLKEADVPEGGAPSEVKQLTELMGQLTEQLSQQTAELAAMKAIVERPEPASADELRRQLQYDRLQDATDGVALPAGPTPDQFDELAAEVRTLAAGVKEALERKPEPPGEDELRRRSQTSRLDDAGVKRTPPTDHIEQLQGQINKLAEAVGEMASQTEQKLTRIEDLATEESRGTKAARQDPLRKRSERVVLDVASQGLGPRKMPPTQRDESTAPQEQSGKALRRLSRDVTFDILMGSQKENGQ